MTRPSLFLTRVLPDPVMEMIRARFTLTASPLDAPPGRRAVVEGCREAEAMICTLSDRVDAEVLEAARRLKVVANYAVGFENIAVDLARARGIVVTYTPDVLTETTADLTWALLLATARRLIEGQRMVESGRWAGWAPSQLLGTDVQGATLGIIGLGRIGRAVARRAAGFGMTVLYCTRRPLPSSTPAEPWQAVSFAQVLERSDFITLHVPLTADTHHLIGREELRRVRSTAILINTSRGPVIDEAALIDALRRGQLAGAGLDVYEREPQLAPGLRELPQVVTLPHLGSATLATRTRMGLLCVENVLAVLEGRPAPTPVPEPRQK